MSDLVARRHWLVNQAIDDILAQFHCIDLVDKVLPTISGASMQAADLYRLHSDRWITAKELPYRTSLDELLEMCSLISIISGDLRSALRARNMPVETLVRLLKHPAVWRYMTDYYPMAYAVLAYSDLTGQLPEQFRSAEARERSNSEWATALQGFLTLNAQLLSDDSLLAFLLLLDDHLVADTHITEMQRAFAGGEAMTSWLSRPGRQELLDGLERMLDFSGALHDFLDRLDALPILRGRIWLHYSYWLGNGGQRVRETTLWLVRALGAVEMPASEKHSATSALQMVFHDLTSLRRYAGQMLDLVSPPVVLPLPAEK